MRKLVSLAVLGVSTVLLAGTTVPATFLRSDAPAIQVDITIAPVTQDEWQLLRRVTPDMYRCSVRVHDQPGSNRVWGTKAVLLRAGESGVETATFGPLHLIFSASIDERRERVEAVATLIRDGKVINKQRSSISLQTVQYPVPR